MGVNVLKSELPLALLTKKTWRTLRGTFEWDNH